MAQGMTGEGRPTTMTMTMTTGPVIRSWVEQAAGGGRRRWDDGGGRVRAPDPPGSDNTGGRWKLDPQYGSSSGARTP